MPGDRRLPPEGRIEFRAYDSDRAFDRIRSGADDLAFLDGSEILDQNLAGQIMPGPPVVFLSTGAMAPEDSPIRGLGDLAGKSVCFCQGSNAHRNLEASMATRGLDFVRKGFTEYGELYDAYDARVCDAAVGETGDLAAARLGAKVPKSRILAESFAAFPVLAVTPTTDPQWSAIVAWAVYTLGRAGLPAGPWNASGLASLPLEGSALGLAEGWQARVVGAAGTYDAIYARNLGERSPLNLPRGANALLEAGGLFATPYRE